MEMGQHVLTLGDNVREAAREPGASAVRGSPVWFEDRGLYDLGSIRWLGYCKLRGRPPFGRTDPQGTRGPGGVSPDYRFACWV